MLSLEAVLVLPVLALLATLLLQVAVVLRDVLLVHEAARSGARVAATTAGSAAPTRAAREAAPELSGLAVSVTPAVRGEGDVVTVVVTATRSVGGVAHRIRGSAVARVEASGG